MIGELFKALLITSLAGSVLAVVISLLRPITKKLFGYSWHYYIWLCVLFVMLMPVRFNVNTTPAPNIATQTVQTQQTVVSKQPETTRNNREYCADSPDSKTAAFAESNCYMG